MMAGMDSPVDPTRFEKDARGERLAAQIQHSRIETGRCPRCLGEIVPRRGRDGFAPSAGCAHCSWVMGDYVARFGALGARPFTRALEHA